MGMHRRGNALVVMEGPCRLQWSRSGVGWHLKGLWPDQQDRHVLTGQLNDGTCYRR
jgi:hypothetical protein